MKIPKVLSTQLPAALLAIAATLLMPTALRAADHGDAPALAQDQGADIADVFLFNDPANTGTNDKVVLIATFHGFITPGEAVNFGVFDPNIRYHFNIYNDHVNSPPPVFGSVKSKSAIAKDLAKVKANRTIDITFSPRITDPQDASGTPPNNTLPEVVQRPSPQTATVTLGGFAKTVKTRKFTGLATTPPTLGATAKDQISTPLTTEDGVIDFFAGEVDDPFFFDIPAFSAFIESVRNGAANAAVFNRGRDTFAGYNCLAIALRIPKSLIINADATKPIVGADFMTQRHATQVVTSKGIKGVGGYKTIDRMGNPAINVALISFDHKDAYNQGTPKTDANTASAKSFAQTDIIPLLKALGVKTEATPIDPYFKALASIAVTKGDVLQLDTKIANSAAGFGKIDATGQVIGGRRLTDDTIDIILTAIAGTNGPLGDNVALDQDGFVPGNTFPFLHVPHQPLPRGPQPANPANPDTNTDDGTRN